MNLKKNGKVFTSKFVGTGLSSFEKRIYWAAVWQMLRNTGLTNTKFLTWRNDEWVFQNTGIQGYSKWLSVFYQLLIHNKLEIAVYVFFYLIKQHSKFLLHTLQVLYMCTLCDSTNINTIMKCTHTKRLLTDVRHHLSKLRSKRRNA